MDDTLRVRLGLRLWPLLRTGVMRWRRRRGAAFALVALLLAGLAPALAAHAAATAPSARSFPLPLGASPGSLAVDPALDRLWVADAAQGLAWVLDGTDGRVLGQVALTADAAHVAAWALGVDAARQRVYVTTTAGTLAILDGRSGAVGAPWAIGAAGTRLTIDGGRVLVLQPSGQAVTVLDPEHRQILATVPLGWLPGALAVDGGARRVYVTNVGGDQVAALNTATSQVVARAALGRAVGDLAVHPLTHRVYVADPAAGSVAVLDGDLGAILATIPVGRAPGGLTISPATAQLFVANADDDTVSVIDTRRAAVAAVVRVGRQPVAVAVNPRTGRVYVANRGDGTVSVFQDRRWGRPGTTAVGGMAAPAPATTDCRAAAATDRDNAAACGP